MEENKNFDLKSVKVHRTLEGTIFEVTAAVIMLCTWVIVIVSRQHTEPDWIGYGGFTVAVTICLLCAYSPRHINVFYIPLRNIRQVALSIRMVRIIAIGLALTALTIAITGPNSPLTKVFAMGILVVVGIIGFIFIYLIQKAE